MLPACEGGSSVRNPDNYLIFGSPLIEPEDINEVVESLKNSWPGTGPKVQRFENDFRAYKGSRAAVAVNSCTAALHLALLASGIKPGDEVITTPMTFCATINAIIHCGAVPVLADCDRQTMNISPEQIELKITPKTKAVLPVHFAGRLCDMDSILSIAQKNNLKVIEDCAHAVEAEYQGRKAGTFGDFGCFSFYANKNLTTGEGGMVISQDEQAADQIKIMALHGMNRDAWRRFSDDGYRHYQVTGCGFKYNMMDLQAGIGIHQLKRLEKYWLLRQKIWDKYLGALQSLSLELPAAIEEGMRHSYHLFPVLIEPGSVTISRDELLSALHAENIGTGVHYLSVPEHPYYRDRFGWQPEDFPNAFEIGRRTLSLPLSPKLSQGDVGDVIQAVTKLCQYYSVNH